MKLKLLVLLLILIINVGAVFSTQQCIECHKKLTPNIVSDWKLSKHSENGVDCSICHGDSQRQHQQDFLQDSGPSNQDFSGIEHQQFCSSSRCPQEISQSHQGAQQ